MLMKHRILSLFCAFHLAFCVFCVLPDRFHPVRNRAWNALAFYGSYTGAANKYGFFAPNVPSARRIRVRVLCGEEWIPVEAPVSSSESAIRVKTISTLAMHKESEEYAAASWAAFGFNRFPCAEAALAEVDFYAVPTMEEYRKGERPGWYPLRVMAFMTREQLKAVEEARR